MRVYLNTNVVERPYDDLEDVRVYREALSSTDIFMLSAIQAITIVSSDILLSEIMLTEDVSKREKVESLVVIISRDNVSLTDKITGLGRRIKAECGIKDFADCLHLSSAANGNCKYFITCDDELINKRSKIELFLKDEGYTLLIKNPVEFVEEWR